VRHSEAMLPQTSYAESFRNSICIGRVEDNCRSSRNEVFFAFVLSRSFHLLGKATEVLKKERLLKKHVCI